MSTYRWCRKRSLNFRHADRDRLPELMTDEWLSDCTLYGPAERIFDGLAAWYDAGLRTPILVPSSAVGNQMKAFEEFFELFDRLR